MAALVKFSPHMFLAGGVLTLATGILSILSSENGFLGLPKISVGIPSDDFVDEDKNNYYKTYYAFTPATLGLHWGPIICGILMIAASFDYFRIETLFNNVLKGCMIMTFVSLFANVGYAGIFGIIFGIVNLILAILLIVAAFINPDASISMDFKGPAKVTASN